MDQQHFSLRLPNVLYSIDNCYFLRMRILWTGTSNHEIYEYYIPRKCVHTDAHTRMHTHIHTDARTHTHTHAYTRTRTRTRIHTHTQSKD